MILRTLAVEGWRCFANRFEIGPLTDGVNVLCGPNSSGKSTLLGALIRGLFDNHGGSAAAIKALRPWGKKLSPTVHIRFEHDGETYTVSKRFLDSTHSEVSREETGKMIRLAEGPEANQWLRNMLSGEAPAKGETTVQHWGIAQVLWAPQKGIALNQLSTNMTAAIQQALGAALLTSSAIENRVEERYLKIFTQGGNLIKGAHAPPVTAMEEKLAEAQKLHDKIDATMKEYDDASRLAEDYRNRRDQAQRDCEQRQRDLDAIRQRAQQYREAQTACDRHRADAAEAQAQYDEMFRRVEGLKVARQELAEAKKVLARSTEDIDPIRRQAEQCRIELENAENRLERIRAGRSTVDRAERGPARRPISSSSTAAIRRLMTFCDGSTKPRGKKRNFAGSGYKSSPRTRRRLSPFVQPSPSGIRPRSSSTRP